jgi:hypothetical protein
MRTGGNTPWVKRGWGVKSSEDTALYSIYVSTLWPHQSQDPSWNCDLYLISNFSTLSTSRGWPSCWRCRWCCRRSAATWTPSGADMSAAAGTLPRRTRTARTTTSRTSAAQCDFPCFIAGKYCIPSCPCTDLFSKFLQPSCVRKAAFWDIHTVFNSFMKASCLTKYRLDACWIQFHA